VVYDSISKPMDISRERLERLPRRTITAKHPWTLRTRLVQARLEMQLPLKSCGAMFNEVYTPRVLMKFFPIKIRKAADKLIEESEKALAQPTETILSG